MAGNIGRFPPLIRLKPGALGVTMARLDPELVHAMAESAQDRTLPATQRKIEKSRAEGQVARSRDLGHLAALGTGAVLIMFFAPQLVAWMGQRLAAGLRFDARTVALAAPRK